MAPGGRGGTRTQLLRLCLPLRILKRFPSVYAPLLYRQGRYSIVWQPREKEGEVKPGRNCHLGCRVLCHAAQRHY